MVIFTSNMITNIRFLRAEIIFRGLVLEDTKHKVEEASFFLVQANSLVTEPTLLGYCLSAFVSAARSVTWVMQREFGKNQEYKSWYQKRQKEMKNDNIFLLFRELRNITIKEGKLEFTRIVTREIEEPPITVHDERGFEVIRDGKVIKKTKPFEHVTNPVSENSSFANLEQPKPSIRVILENAPDNEGMELCTKYLKKISDLVSEAEKMMNEPKE